MKTLPILGALFLTATLASAAWIPGWSTTNTPAAASNYVFSIAKAATNGIPPPGTGSSNITDNAYTAVARNLAVSTNLHGSSALLTNAYGQTIAQQMATNHVWGSNIDGTISVSEIDAQTLVVSNAPIFLDTSLTNASGQTIAQEAAAVAQNATNGVVHASSYVGQQPLTNNLSGRVTYSTNLTTMAPDWNIKYSTITTNAAWVFLAPLNFVATEFQSSVIFVTNSTASAVAVTVPAGWHTQGTWYCTNVTTFTVSHYGTIFTNAIAFPLW